MLKHCEAGTPTRLAEVQAGEPARDIVGRDPHLAIAGLNPHGGAGAGDGWALHSPHGWAAKGLEETWRRMLRSGGGLPGPAGASGG